MQPNEPLTGGCQCGAIRYRVTGEILDASICNCRMCQKATGGVFAAYVSVKAGDFAWTRGTPAEFASSTVARRKYCARCGTPLTYEWTADRLALTLGSFDNPRPLMPTVEYARENRHPFLARLAELDAVPLAETVGDGEALSQMRVFQHPDRDTERWPPKKGVHHG